MTSPQTSAAETRVVAVLGFHKIGPPPSGGWDTWFYIAEERFVAQLRCLRDDGWTIIDAAAFVEGLRTPDTLPAKSALLTFDDGYKTMRTVTLPLLKELGCPGVLFVPSDFIGGFNGFDEGVEPREAICDWDDLRVLEANGVSIQSHGVSHRALSTLAAADVQAEITRSKAVLEAGLRKPVELFSYPYGDAGLDRAHVCATMAQAPYCAAFLYGGGPCPMPNEDRYHLSRLAIGPDTDLRTALNPQ